MSIEGKKILFFAPKFFGYEQDVRDEMVAQGAQVYFLPDRPSDKSYIKALYRFAPQILNNLSDKYYVTAVNQFSQKTFDFVFIKSGEALTINFLKRLKSQYIEAKFIYYTYDSIANKKGQLEKIRFCDISYSFDLIDSKNHNIRFRPLFFSKGFENSFTKNEYKYDLSFVGTAHSDRHTIVSNIKLQLNTNIRFFVFLYLQAKWVYLIKKCFLKNFKNEKIENYSFESISKKNVQEIFKNSKVILDIEHPDQSGLTMRTFEALGAEKKLITTNSSIKNMDFYNSKNILIIDRKNPVINFDFFNSSYQKIDDRIYSRYTLNSWIKEIFSDTDK